VTNCTGLTDVLTASFLAALSSSAQVADAAALSSALTASVAAARARFPGVEFDGSAIGRHLGEKVTAEADVLAALSRLRTEELCLVCACLAGDLRALQLFDTAYLGPVAERLRRSGLSRQRIAGSLLIADASGSGRLVTYSGRGDLAGWLYVAIAREARRLAGREARFAPADDLELADERVGGDLELAHLKATYGEAFRRSFHAALAELDEQARRLVRVREELALRTRALLVQDLGLSASESDGVLRLVRSQLDLSLTRVLGPARA
jgi:RNA polymerase sigma-70 factor (ECF subfamily)